MDSDTSVLTVDDVAALLAVTRRAVLEAIRRGELPAKKFGNHLGYRIRRVDNEAWLATPTNRGREQSEKAEA